ncbi:(3S,6E)-nerolidol synthase 1-like isoform X2 [Malania oleifera]|uniref:(3S,6E)-nerolidol synthase 1-like isoform X2 n=1 Tax=Malania oleifera TaxID=397392 RepID=UPI0025AE1ABF|nr:(3S,6E)-nerolidol synthase 1-like isoform X2 [Malania oleifera]
MAFTHTFHAFSSLSGYPCRITCTSKTEPTEATPTFKWNIDQNHTSQLITMPSKHYKDEFLIEYPKKLNQAKQLLWKMGEDPLQGLMMVDAIQRLGIGYNFQDEIEALLRNQYAKLRIDCDDLTHDLYEVALRFRLLRQQDIFNKFKDEEGKFDKKKLSKDIRGLMALYEASQLSMEGEDILDEAMEYSISGLLNAQAPHLDHHQAAIVANTLENPYHKSLARFMSKSFLSNFQGTGTRWMNVLCELTKLDSYIAQSVHRSEMLQISKWWSDMGLAKELKFARDQPLKWYMWPMAILADPSLSEQRVDLTKPISLIYIIDDIYDVIGTLDELTLFTQAVNRWEFAAAEQLPVYMKKCFATLDEITDEISHKVYIKHGWNPVNSLRKTWASLCNAFLVEANWFASGSLPKAEEYLKNGAVSSGVHIVLVHIFFLLGEGITEDAVDCLDGTPPIVSSTATLLRLWDDLGSAKDENQDGHDGSYIEYYMMEYPEASVESAKEHVIYMISEMWKRLNKECLSPHPFSTSFVQASLNLARMVPLMYSYDDNQCLPRLEEHMKSILV